MSKAAPHLSFDVLSKEIATQQYVIELAPGPAAEDADRYAAKLLATILGDDTGSRLYWELVDPGLAEQVTLSHCEYLGAGLMITYMSCEPHCVTDNLQSIIEGLSAGRSRGRHRGRIGAGQKQNPLADRALRRTPPRPACSPWAANGSIAANIDPSARN